MQLPLLYLVAVSALSPAAAVKTAPANDTVCQCFQTNGSNPAVYSQHRFFDFRNLEQYRGPPPPPVRNASAAPNALATSDFFLSKNWTDSWGIQNWNNSVSPRADASVLMVNTPNNVYIEQNTDGSTAAGSWLTLRTTRQSNFQSAAEVTSSSEGYRYMSIRMLARTVGVSGGCTALFTYRGTSRATVQEADMEILTKGPRNTIQYTNQPAVDSNGHLIDGATKNVTLPGGREWSEWAVHRLDWTPRKSTWYLDGAETASITYQVPRDPSRIILNSWSDGGAWTGNMTDGGAVYYQIQWIEITYNSTDPTPATGSVGESGESEGSDDDDDDDDDDDGSYWWWWGGRMLGSGAKNHGGTRQVKARQVEARQAPLPAGPCDTMCSIDETDETGTPVLLLSDARRSLQVSAPAGWLPLVAVLATTYMSVGLLQY